MPIARYIYGIEYMARGVINELQYRLRGPSQAEAAGKAMFLFILLLVISLPLLSHSVARAENTTVYVPISSKVRIYGEWSDGYMDVIFTVTAYMPKYIVLEPFRVYKVNVSFQVDFGEGRIGTLCKTCSPECTHGILYVNLVDNSTGSTIFTLKLPSSVTLGTESKIVCIDSKEYKERATISAYFVVPNNQSLIKTLLDKHSLTLVVRPYLGYGTWLYDAKGESRDLWDVKESYIDQPGVVYFVASNESISNVQLPGAATVTKTVTVTTTSPVTRTLTRTLTRTVTVERAVTRTVTTTVTAYSPSTTRTVTLTVTSTLPLPVTSTTTVTHTVTITNYSPVTSTVTLTKSRTITSWATVTSPVTVPVTSTVTLTKSYVSTSTAYVTRSVTVEKPVTSTITKYINRGVSQTAIGASVLIVLFGIALAVTVARK